MTDNPVRPITPMELLALAMEIAKDHSLDVGEHEDQTQFEYIEAVLCELVSKLEDKQEFEKTHADLRYDLDRAIQMRDYHDATSRQYRLRLRALSDKVQRYCRKLVFQSLTHGQKNGAILMLAALVEGEGLDDTGTNDIPF